MSAFAPAEGKDPTPPGISDSARTLGQGTTITVVGTVLLFALNFVGRVTAARELSVADWGLFNLGLSLTGLLATMSLLGLAQATARTLAYETDEEERRTVIRWVVLTVAAIAIVSSLAVFFLAQPLATVFHDPPLAGVLEILAVTVGFTVVSTILAAIFQGFRNVFPNALFNQIVNPSLFVVGVVLFYVLHVGLDGVLVASVVASGGAFVGLLLYTRRRLASLGGWSGPRHPRPRPQLWHLSTALWGVTSLAFITAFADTIILGVYRSSTVVGYYSAAMNLARVVLLGGGAVTYIYLPIAAHLERRRSYEEMRSVFLTATRWIVALTFPFFVLFVFAPDFTLEAIFGSRYGAGGAALQVIGLSAFFAGALGPVNVTLTGLAEGRVQFATSSTAAVANIAFSFALIPSYGLLGAAYAWAIARALYPALGWVVLHRRHRLTPFRLPFLVPLALALAIAAPVTFAVGHLGMSHYAVVGLYFLGLGAYVGAILGTRYVLPDDLIVVEFTERLLGRPFPRARRLLHRFMRPTVVG